MSSCTVILKPKTFPCNIMFNSWPHMHNSREMLVMMDLLRKPTKKRIVNISGLKKWYSIKMNNRNATHFKTFPITIDPLMNMLNIDMCPIIDFVNNFTSFEDSQEIQIHDWRMYVCQNTYSDIHDLVRGVFANIRLSTSSSFRCSLALVYIILDIILLQKWHLL